VDVSSFSSRLASASEHLVSYLDRSDKQVVSTTYKDIHVLVDKVAESGFFDAVSCVSAEPDTETAVTEPASDEAEPQDEMEPATVGDGMLPVSCWHYCHMLPVNCRHYCCLWKLSILVS